MGKFLRLLSTRFFICAVGILVEFVLVVMLASFLSDLFMPAAVLGWLIHIAALLYLINRDEIPEFKLPWMMLMLLVPFLGTLIFILFTRDNVSKSTVRRMEEVKESFMPYVAQSGDVMDKLKKADPDAHAQAAYLYSVATMPCCEGTQTRYYPLGEDFFVDLLHDLKNAKKYIFMEYFIVERGEMWDAIHEVLLQKVKEGVQVYFMYDDFGCMTTLPQHYYQQLRSEGIRCQPSNQFKPILSHIHNNRDHRKITVIDGQIGYTGGVNLADEYINKVVRFGHWKDTAIRLEGTAVRSLTILFLSIWNVQSAQRLPVDDYLAAPAPAANDGCIIPFGDGPAPVDEYDIGKGVYMNMINAARDYLYITTPYLICDHELLSALRTAALRGVDVRLITPHIPDKKTVFLMTRSNYAQLLRDGVKIFEYTPGFIHAKNFVCDDKFAVCGTINLDYRSLVHHFECGAWMYDTAIVADMKADFLKTQAVSEQMREDMALLKPWQLISARVMKVFSPLL